MEKIKKYAAVIILMTAAIVGILFGLFAMAGANQTYETAAAEYQNRHLMGITASTEKNWNAYLEVYGRSAADFAMRTNAVNAEVIFTQTGRGAEMIRCMNQHKKLLLPEPEAALSLRTAQGLETGTGSPRCTEEHEPGTSACHLTMGEDDVLYLSACYTKNNGSVYSIHVPLRQLLEAAVSNAVSDGTMLILDESMTAVYCIGRDELAQTDPAALREDFPGLDISGLFALAEGGAFSDIIENMPGIPGRGWLVSCVTADLTSQRILFATVMEREAAAASLPETGTRTALYMLLICSGAAVLAATAFYLVRSNRRTVRELRELREQSELLRRVEEQRRAEAHAQRLQEVGTMAAGIVHEFNNLLTPIMGYTMMTLEALPEDSESYDNLLEVYGASVKAKDMIRRIGSLSKNNADLTYTPIRIDPLVRQAVGMAGLSAPSTVRIETDLHAGDACVIGSETMLNQTVLNLCINALQAMESSGDLLIVSTVRTHLHDHDWVEILVRDTGPGIAEKDLMRIFEPFYTTKEAGRGTGLGLAVCRHIIETHNGFIRAENNIPPPGASFRILLPEAPSTGEDEI